MGAIWAHMVQHSRNTLKHLLILPVFLGHPKISQDSWHPCLKSLEDPQALRIEAKHLSMEYRILQDVTTWPKAVLLGCSATDQYTIHYLLYIILVYYLYYCSCCFHVKHMAHYRVVGARWEWVSSVNSFPKWKRAKDAGLRRESQISTADTLVLVCIESSQWRKKSG